MNDAIKRMDNARGLSVEGGLVTCPASRHAQLMAEMLVYRRPYPMLAEEPEYCGESIAHTVAALWEARAKIAELEGKLEAVDGQAPITAPEPQEEHIEIGRITRTVDGRIGVYLTGLGGEEIEARVTPNEIVVKSFPAFAFESNGGEGDEPT